MAARKVYRTLRRSIGFEPLANQPTRAFLHAKETSARSILHHTMALCLSYCLTAEKGEVWYLGASPHLLTTVACTMMELRSSARLLKLGISGGPMTRTCQSWSAHTSFLEVFLDIQGYDDDAYKELYSAWNCLICCEVCSKLKAASAVSQGRSTSHD
ncbi:hypothetical protein BU25DRAFT_426633 [Macroventuria anomochaeta]|uniref:Uncharacterized protein n=1 Tax=Macroventuria anomochaeta TaxID=301207 RepID=A0ACB6RJT6_9PLEO|nr:uncharacterized protein BU25DRAFT_426633 [Macroventuria anomochaeta]KAF2621234.1 hypothetical protein BU25DRAFT_426633 [Macroventuria anomochaeta]